MLTHITQDFLPNLKDHLLPRIMTILRHEVANRDMDGRNTPSNDMPMPNVDPEIQGDRDRVFFKNDQIYQHKLAQFNYTTYDVRRAQDVINPDTSRCNIMVLAPNKENTSLNCPFFYARVLGIYHANVVYIGPGMVDYSPRRLEFLWVRWYHNVAPMHSWKMAKLDRLQFFPAADERAFGFVDPGDVLRGCYIAPAFSAGKVHPDGNGLSRCARDSQDWRCYFVNRCV